MKEIAELKRIDFEGTEFPFEPESYVGNHLMKTVAMNMFLKKKGYKAVITCVRWDEQETRANETYFSPREKPKHTRIHPILHFTEKDVRDTIHKYKIPVNPLYEKGVSLAWCKKHNKKNQRQTGMGTGLRKKHLKDLEGDKIKKKIMKRLRDLGYM